MFILVCMILMICTLLFLQTEEQLLSVSVPSHNGVLGRELIQRGSTNYNFFPNIYQYFTKGGKSSGTGVHGVAVG